MQRVDPAQLSPTSVCAAVARGGSALPDFVFADQRGTLLSVARWRRRHSELHQPARLDEHLLSYTVAGRAAGTLVIDGQPLAMRYQPGSVLFLPAGCSVTWTMDAPCEVVHLHVYIAAHALSAHLADSRPCLLRDPWLAGFFHLLSAEHDACSQQRRVEDSRFLDDTADMLLRHLGSLTQEPPPPRPADGVSALRPFLLRRVQAFVQDHLGEAMSLDRLAGVAQMSVDHFVRAFHKATGETPHQYLLQRRIDNACTLLRETGHGVADIAHRCGFAGAAHFSTTFRQHRGLTPSQYRQRQ